MILLRSFLSGHIRIKRTLEYYDAGIGPRVPFGGGFGPTVSANFAVALGDFTTLSTTSTMPTGGSISRAGNAMLYDATGKLTYAPNNVWLQNNTFATSPWYLGGGTALASNTNNAASAPDGTTTAGVLVTGAGSATWTQNVTSNGGDYIVSVWARVPSGTATMTLGMGGASGSLSVTTTWQRFSFRQAAFTAGTQQVSINLTSANTTYHLWGGQVEAVTYQTSPSGTYYLNYPTPNTTSAYYGPRFDYEPVTLQPKGLLVEGTRTNLLVQSQNITTTWAKANAGDTVSATAATSPTGETNGNSFTADGTSVPHFVYNTSNGFVANTVQTWSVYLKNPPSNAANYVYFDTYYSGATNGYISQIVNLTNGTLSQISVGSSASVISTQIQNVGNGWYRVSVTGTINGTGAPVFAVGIAATATGNTFDGFGRVNSFATSASFYMFGAQVETAAFASSYTGNTGTGTLTRAAETFSLTGYANRLVEAFYIDEQTGANYSGNSALSTGTVTISPPTFGWVTSLRAYTNAYAGSISTPSWLSFSRAGNAMYYDSTGTLTFAANNLLLNTATLSTQTVTTGIIPTCDVILSFKGTGSVAISGGYTGTLAGTGASDRVFLKFTTTTASLTFTVTGTVTEAQLERVTYQTQPSLYVANTGSQSYGPRYDFDPSTVPATPRGLLIEEQRVNVVPSSNAFTGAGASFWTPNNSPSITTTNIAPDGTATANSWAFNTSNTGYYSTLITMTGSVTYAFSAYVKAISGTPIVRFGSDTLGFGGGANTFTAYVDFAPSTGTFSNVQSGVIAYDKQNVGNGWWRIWLTTTKNSTTAAIGNIVYLQSAGTAAVWGYQIEHAGTAGTPTSAPFITSLIPTTTASVTRAADVAQLTGSALTTLQGANWTFVGEIGKIPQAFLTPVGVLGQNTFSKNAVRYNGTATDLNLWSDDGTTQAFTSPVAASTNNTRIGIAGTASLTSMVACAGTVQTLAKPMIWTNGFYLGLGPSGGGNPLNSTYRSLAIYNQRLPNTILAQKSTVGSPY